MNKFTTKFLCSFFELFDAYIIEIHAQNEKVKGIVSYTDESGIQEFEWILPQTQLWNDVIYLLDFIYINNYFSGDKITISSEELSFKINKSIWTVYKVDIVLKFIFSIKISMIDNNQNIDYFFLHK